MKFDTVIIGGGLTGLLCGIRLQRKGLKCAVISAGQSAMHFWSGAFDLLNRMPDGTEVDRPLESMGKLPPTHPYSIIGTDKLPGHLRDAMEIFGSFGFRTHIPENLGNIFRLSSMGSLKRCFMTMEALLTTESPEKPLCRRALVACPDGFLDFNSEFVAKGVEDSGSPCRTVTIRLEALKNLRKSPTEMRATNISRVLDRPTFKEYISQIREKYDGEDLIVLPAIFSLADSRDAIQIGKVMNTKVRFVATMPPSVPGIEIQRGLTELFRRSGGTLFKGDTVISGRYDSDRLAAVRTANISDMEFTADSFILAGGSFFSNGLKADRNGAYEPALGIDIDAPRQREDWFDADDFFGKQDYMGIGAKLTPGAGLRASRDGRVIGNLLVAGSILGGCNPLYEGCGGGVSICSALEAADSIAANHRDDRRK